MTAVSDEPPWADRIVLARLIRDVRYRRHVLDGSELQGFRWQASAAQALIRAAGTAGHDRIVVGGAVDGDLELPLGVRGSLALDADVAGSLVVQGEICGALEVAGSVSGNVSIGGGANVLPTVSGDLVVAGSLGGDLLVKDVVVMGDLDLSGVVDGDVRLSGHVVGRTRVSGSVGHSLTIRCSDVEISGRVGTVTRLSGLDNSPLKLRSVNGADFADEVLIGDHVSIEACDFRDCAGLNRFNFSGSFAELFPSSKGLLLTKLVSSYDELASANRQLRA